MAIVKGKVWFSSESRNAVKTIGIAYVRVVLKNTVTNFGVGVLTNEDGEYTISNVPVGEYKIVEEKRFVLGDKIYSEDFTVATSISEPVSGDPEVERCITAMRLGANKLQSITPNTVSVKIIDNAEEKVVDFIDAPVLDASDYKSGMSLVGENIFDFLGKGMCGTLPEGTSVNTSEVDSPYPDDIEVSWNYFEYDGGVIAELSGYTISNTLNMGDQGNGYRLFDLSDHSFGDERGRMVMIKHESGRRTIISEEISVKRNTDYTFSFWAANIVQAYSPTIAYPFIFQNVVGSQENRILVQFGKGINNCELIPVWREVYSTFNSGENDNVVVSIEVDQQEDQPSYFAIDDISLFEFERNQKATLVKTVDKTKAYVGDILTYNLVLSNNSNKDISNVLFTDEISQYTDLQIDSIKFDGNVISAKSVLRAVKPLVKNGETVTLNYKVKILNNQNMVPFLENKATATYQYDEYRYDEVSQELTQLSEGVASETVSTAVSNVGVEVIKCVNKTRAAVGEVLTYMITIVNRGVVVLDNVILTECISRDIRYIRNSLRINGRCLSQAQELKDVLICRLAPGESRTISYDVKIVSASLMMRVESMSKVRYEYPIPQSMMKEYRYAESNICMTEIIGYPSGNCCNCR